MRRVGGYSIPGDYVHFKSQVPLQKISIGAKQWRYYDYGPKVVPPLICLPGTAGTADVYYKQIMSLSSKGFRVISVDIPCVWSHQEWVHSFEKFLDAVDIHHQTETLSSFEAACGNLRQAYRQFLGAVIELINGEVDAEELKEMAKATYEIFAASGIVHDRKQCLSEKKYFFDLARVHLYGTSLGGFLAQLFAQHRPRRVRSLVLSNTFLETRCFGAAMRWSSLVNWTPSFLLKRYILTGIQDGPHEPFIADSVDFVVCQLETLSREDLASRLTLNTAAASVGRVQLSDSCITLMDTNDYCAIPQQLKDQVGDRYPGARRAFLKTGADFPFLSRPDEVNLYLQLHLRHVGLDARPDSVLGASRDGSAGSPTEEREEHLDDPASNGNASSTQAGDTPPASETETHGVDEQLLGSASAFLAAKSSTDLLSILLVFMEKSLATGAAELLCLPQVASPLVTLYTGVL